MLSKKYKLYDDSHKITTINVIKLNVQNCPIFSMITYIWSKNVYESIKHQIQGIVFLWGGQFRDGN